MAKTIKKSKAELQQISDVAWLVRQGDKRLGILNKDIQEKFFYINGRNSVKFENEKDVVQHFGNAHLFTKQINEPTTVNEGFFIKGFEVDYEQPYPLDNSHPDYNDRVPLYTKTADSDVYYAAGWYGINFEKGWKRANGPKYSTLATYGFVGPFKSEIDCKIEVKNLNKARK